MNFIKERIEIIEKAKKINGDRWFKRTGQYRYTGFSTGQAFKYIGSCLMNPEKVYKITDHIGTKVTNDYQMRLIRNLVSETKLDGFYFHRTKNLMVYSLKDEIFAFNA